MSSSLPLENGPLAVEFLSRMLQVMSGPRSPQRKAGALAVRKEERKNPGDDAVGTFFSETGSQKALEWALIVKLERLRESSGTFQSTHACFSLRWRTRYALSLRDAG